MQEEEIGVVQGSGDVSRDKVERESEVTTAEVHTHGGIPFEPSRSPRLLPLSDKLSVRQLPASSISLPLLPSPLPSPSSEQPPPLPPALTPPPAFPEKFRYLVCTSSWLGGRPTGGQGVIGSSNGLGQVNGLGYNDATRGRRNGYEDGLATGDVLGFMRETPDWFASVDPPGISPLLQVEGPHADSISNGLGPYADHSYQQEGNADAEEFELGMIARRAGMRLRIRRPTEMEGGSEADGLINGFGDRGQVESRLNGLAPRRIRPDVASGSGSTGLQETSQGEAFDTISLSSQSSTMSSPRSPNGFDSSSHSQSTITLPLLNIASLSLTIHFLRSRPDISLAFLLGLTGLTWLWQLLGAICWQVVAGVAVLVAAGLRVGVELARRRGWMDEGTVRRVEKERVRREKRRAREKKREEVARRNQKEVKAPQVVLKGRVHRDGAEVTSQSPAKLDDNFGEATQPGLEIILPHREHLAEPLTPDRSLQALALEALKTVIQKSDGFDEAIGRALGLLSQDESDSSVMEDSDRIPNRELRQRLDQALNTVVSQLTTSTQNLLPLISHEELATFSEMYSIEEDRLSRRSSSTASRPLSTGMSDASKRLSGMSLGVFSDLFEEGLAGHRPPEQDYPTRNGGTGLATAKGKRGALTEQDSPLSPDIALPPLSTPLLRSSRSASYLRLGSPNATHDRFTSFPMRSPRPPSRQSWTASVDRSFSSSEEDGGFGQEGVQTGLGHLRTGSEVVTPRRGYRYGSQPKSVQEDSEADELREAKSPERTRPVSMYRLSSRMDTAAVPLPRPRSSLETHAPPIEPAVDAAITGPPARPTHGLRKLRLSQSNITGVTGLPLSLPFPGSPVHRQGNLSDHGSSDSPPRFNGNLDRKWKRASWQEVGSQRLVSMQLSPSDARRRNRTSDGSAESVVPGIQPGRLENQFGSDSLQRSNSIPIRRNGHSRANSSVHMAGSYPPATFPLAQQPFPRSAEAHSTINGHLATPLRPRASRTVSLGPLTLSALKASYLGMHLKRRKAACCLLALRFDQSDIRFLREDVGDATGECPDLDPIELAKYWGAVLGALEELNNCLSDSSAAIQADLSRSVPIIAPSARPSGLHRFSVYHDSQSFSHAPGPTDSELLVERADSMSAALRKLQMKLGYFGAETNDPSELELTWGMIREDLGGVIRDWEKGRTLIKRMVVEQDGGDGQLDKAEDLGDLGSGHEADADGLLTSDYPVKPPMQLCPHVEPQMDSDGLDKANGIDDASKHLIQATSPAFLPPPGIESVFEAHSMRADDRKVEEAKLSRDERIKAVKAARAGGKSPLQSSFAQETALDPINRTSRDVRTRTGEMVNELKGVIGELRRRKDHGMPGASEGTWGKTINGQYAA